MARKKSLAAAKIFLWALNVWSCTAIVTSQNESSNRNEFNTDIIPLKYGYFCTSYFTRVVSIQPEGCSVSGYAVAILNTLSYAMWLTHTIAISRSGAVKLHIVWTGHECAWTRNGSRNPWPSCRWNRSHTLKLYIYSFFEQTQILMNKQYIGWF